MVTSSKLWCSTIKWSERRKKERKKTKHRRVKEIDISTSTFFRSFFFTSSRWSMISIFLLLIWTLYTKNESTSRYFVTDKFILFIHLSLFISIFISNTFDVGLHDTNKSIRNRNEKNFIKSQNEVAIEFPFLNTLIRV